MGKKAVLFDLFGTLVNTVSPADYQDMLRRVAAAMDVPEEPFSAQWRADITTRESGKLGGVEELLLATAKRAGSSPSPEAVKRGAEAWLSVARRWLTPRGQAPETLRKIREAGYGLGLVSNCSAEVPRLWSDNPLRSLIHAPVFSCEAGTMKPDPAIYHRACGLLGVAPEDCFFVGDGGAQELSAATALGMTAILIRVPGEEHTWFDANYRQDALQWEGPTVEAIEALTQVIR